MLAWFLLYKEYRKENVMNYLIATHGNLASGFRDSLNLIIGAPANLDIFQMTKEKSAADAEDEARKMLDSKQGEQLMVFTDVFGGSVANLFTQFLLEGYEFELITGVNLPMLLTALLAGEPSSSGDSVKNSLQEGIKGIQYVNDKINEVNDNDIIFDED